MRTLREPLIAAACGLLALGFIAGLIALACDLFKDRGACLASHVTPAYSYVQPTFVPGPNGTTKTIYTPVFVPEGVECDRWEFPDGRP
ncbi:hypothetical protein [Sphingomonas aerolata]|uniref:hypothetical protein n=1 Tax=Sphingomonas aerolata TaxID=185951 RepID=UPI00208EDBA6|nr:hypothetical protein [Sphingomonas aerolata]USQ99546.1 hypothetical protein NEF64_14135 [Sphingomonas aerolata]